MTKFFQDLRALRKAYDDKLKNEGEAAMKEAFKEVFDKHPCIDSVYWTQYTPYFNDGDPCYFRMNEFEVEWDEDEADTDHDAAIEDINEIFEEAGEDVFEQLFGDHKRIEVTREGISIRKYSHD
jgi:hypothetical protein